MNKLDKKVEEESDLTLISAAVSGAVQVRKLEHYRL